MIVRCNRCLIPDHAPFLRFSNAVAWAAYLLVIAFLVAMLMDGAQAGQY